MCVCGQVTALRRQARPTSGKVIRKINLPDPNQDSSHRPPSGRMYSGHGAPNGTRYNSISFMVLFFFFKHFLLYAYSNALTCGKREQQSRCTFQLLIEHRQNLKTQKHKYTTAGAAVRHHLRPDTHTVLHVNMHVSNADIASVFCTLHD